MMLSVCVWSADTRRAETSIQFLCSTRLIAWRPSGS